MFKRVIQHSLFTLVNLLLVFSCVDGNNANDEIIDKEFIERTYSEEDFLESKKHEIVVFYDNIGFEIIDLILTDRVYETNPESRTKLQDVSLDSFPERLNKEVEINISKYAIELIEFKNQMLDSINNETIVADFIFAKDSLLDSDFFIKTIMIDGKEKDPLYVNLISSIEGHAVRVKSRLIEINKEQRIKNIDNEADIKRNLEIGNEKEETKDYSFLWLGLLVISMLTNIFQFIFYKKKTERRKRNATQIEREAKNENRIESRVNNDSNYAVSMPSRLKTSEVSKIIDEAYNQMGESLSKDHHEDCIDIILPKFETLKSKTIQDITTRSFNNKEEVIQFITPKLNIHSSTLREELLDCLSKDQAIQRIDASIKTQNFTDKINTVLVSEEEIQMKIDQHKQIFFSELENTMNREHLSAQVDILENDIMSELQKIMKSSLIYYFPFTDANGVIDDEKKTKTVERDSAIKLSVNPENISKATFVLLYEEDNMMQAGIMSYDSFLIPICELKSKDFNSTGTRIEQTGDDGTMELEDGYWKVKTKLPIKVI